MPEPARSDSPPLSPDPLSSSPDPYEHWRNPPRLVRASVVGFVCAMPGASLAAQVGLFAGHLEWLTIAGGLIGFGLGTTLELVEGSSSDDRHSEPRPPEETGPAP